MHANEITAGATLVRYHEQFSGNVTREDRPVVTSVEPYGSDHVKVRLASGEVVILRDTATVEVETDDSVYRVHLALVNGTETTLSNPLPKGEAEATATRMRDVVFAGKVTRAWIEPIR